MGQSITVELVTSSFVSLLSSHISLFRRFTVGTLTIVFILWCEMRVLRDCFSFMLSYVCFAPSRHAKINFHFSYLSRRILMLLALLLLSMFGFCCLTLTNLFVQGISSVAGGAVIGFPVAEHISAFGSYFEGLRVNFLIIFDSWCIWKFIDTVSEQELANVRLNRWVQGHIAGELALMVAAVVTTSKSEEKTCDGRVIRATAKMFYFQVEMMRVGCECVCVRSPPMTTQLPDRPHSCSGDCSCTCCSHLLG
jgi:hypothetical protein